MPAVDSVIQPGHGARFSKASEIFRARKTIFWFRLYLKTEKCTVYAWNFLNE